MKTKHPEADVDTEELIRPSKRLKIEDSCYQSAVDDSSQSLANLSILAQTALSYVKDQPSTEESGHGFTVNESQACLYSDMTARQGAGDQVSGPAEPHRQLSLLSKYPYKPRTVPRVSPTEREQTNLHHSAKSVQGCTIEEHFKQTLPCSSLEDGLQMLAQTALSTLPSPVHTNSSAAFTTTVNVIKGRPQPSKLEQILLDLNLRTNSLQSQASPEQTTPDDNYQLPRTGSSRRKKREPRRRVPFEGVTGTQTSTCTENASCKGSSRRRARKRTILFDDSDELIPKKTVKLSTSNCEISTVTDKDILQPRKTLVAKRPRISEVSQRQTLYNSLIANWKKQLDDWKARNRAIDSKHAHKMKYPSHLHEWLERVKFSHNRKWKLFQYEEPRWTPKQLALTRQPGSSLAA
ncbi:uncharacterized protein LOC128191562 [Crassostrea angulata]|uniref:uncharacterized protein LOC128191562 n=1 Tax=Magallana angulata TaxID=2784310 RepID=UPI0022B1C8FC|nr:uncharacterized protein LOC128191562 [Crassostrea angulata]